ncbi:MAG TPA: hypothetical protein VK856_04500 [Anaerolineaceae bacterium]|nr:hypothetical protein [Anaerolineaceae bacterium]
MSLKNPRIYSITGMVLFGLGLAIGLFLWTGTVWADLEGYMFQPAPHADRSEYFLQCPKLITTSDFGIISIGIENNDDKDVRKVVRGNKSLGFLIYIAADETTLELKPGESEVVHWYIYPEDAAWDRFVLFRVNIISSNAPALTTASCGVMVVNVPFLNSNQLLFGLLLLGFIFITSGIFLMNQYSKQVGDVENKTVRLFIILTGILIIGLILSMFGQWLIGGLLLVVMYLLLVVSITHYIQKSTDK